MTSTTTGLDLESMLDGATEATSDDDLSTTIDTTDAYAIKRQIQSLETMYSEVSVMNGNLSDTREFAMDYFMYRSNVYLVYRCLKFYTERNFQATDIPPIPLTCVTRSVGHMAVCRLCRHLSVAGLSEKGRRWMI